MSEKRDFHENSEAVQAHLSIAQFVIQRMASNSTSCKTLSITLVAAILVIVGDAGKPEYALIALLPTLLFLILDAYYLALERMFRTSYNSFIDKLHSGNVSASDLYAITPSGDIVQEFLAALTSFSIWPFYGTLLAMIVLVKAFVF